MVRAKRQRPQGLPTTKKARKRKSQVRQNKSTGSRFENEMVKIFTQYLKEKEVVGMVYKLPDGKNYNQWLDILVDSEEFGYIAIECKSIRDSTLKNEKIYTRKLSRSNAEFGHQFKKQHYFLQMSGRFGIAAFKFEDMNEIFLVPHQYIYDRIENGSVFITMTEIMRNAYQIGSDGSLKLFIRKKCRVA